MVVLGGVVLLPAMAMAASKVGVNSISKTAVIKTNIIAGLADSSQTLFPLPVANAVYSFENDNLPAEVNGVPFKVLDASRDVAESAGKKVFRLLTKPRLIYKDDNGIFRVRPKGWTLFGEKPETKVATLPAGGYEYAYNTAPGENIVVTAGNFDSGVSGLPSIKPATVPAVLAQKDDGQVTTVSEIYPGIDVGFIDRGYGRQRVITIKQKPEIDYNKTDRLIFWENYSYPAGSVLQNWDGTVLKDGSQLDVTPVKIKLPSGETFMISAAIVFDATQSEALTKAAPTLVKIDQLNNRLSLGLVVTSQYLNNPSLVYPVTIDPLYYSCGQSKNLKCFYSDYYYRQDWNGGVLTDERVDVADKGVYINKGLFTGANIVQNDRVTRETAVWFAPDTYKLLDSEGTITQSSLWMYFLGKGAGNNNNAVSLEAKYINKALGCQGNVGAYLNYKTFAGCVSTMNNPQQINPGAAAGWKTWNISYKANDWLNVPDEALGMIVEPTNAWDGLIKNHAPNWNDMLLVFQASENAGANAPYLQVTLEYSDLIDGATIMPNGQAGKTTTANFRVANIGLGDAKAQFGVNYYVTPFASCQNKATAIVSGTYNVNGVFVGQTDSRNINITIPQNAADGSYCLYFEIDPNNTVPEANNGNNSQFVIFAVTNDVKPDLIISEGGNDKRSVIAGNEVLVTTTIKNVGTAGSGLKPQVYYFLNGVDLNYESVTSIVLNKNQSDQISQPILIPANFPLGNFAMTIKVDPNNYIDEIDEFNNTVTRNLIVTGNIDLQPKAFTANNNKILFTGDSVTYSVPIKNVGVSDSNDVQYYIQLRDIQTNAVYKLTNLSPETVNLTAGFDQNVNLSGVIPQNMPPAGTYQVSVMLDPHNYVGETNDANNVAFGSSYQNVEQAVFGGDNNGNGVPDNAEIQAGIKTPKPSVPLVGANEVKNNKANAADLGGVAITGAAKTGTNSPTVPAVLNQGGDPVNTRTGALELEQSDLKIPGRGQFINFIRTYNSRTPDINGRLGNGWSSNYDMYYYQDPVTKNVQIYLGGAVAATFNTADNGATFSAPSGYTDTLKIVNENFEYRTQAGVRYQFSTVVSQDMKMLSNIIDTNGNTTALGYTLVRGIQLLTSITDASNRQVVISYPPSDDPQWDKISRIQDFLDGQKPKVVRYYYDAENNLTMVKNNVAYEGAGVDSITNYTYDGVGHLITYTNPNGAILTNEYDGANRVVKQFETNPRIDAPGTSRLVYSFNYSQNPDPNVPGSAHCTTLTTYRDKNNFYISKTCFNVGDLKIFEADGLGGFEKWTYDNNGQILTYQNKVGDITTYEYDASRRLTKVIAPDTNTWHSETTYTYENNNNRVLTQTDTMWPLATPAQKTTRVFSYTVDQNNGDILTATDPLGKTITSTYDGYGNVSGQYTKSGHYTLYQYDFNHNYNDAQNTEVKQADGSVLAINIATGHDIYGNLTNIEDGRGYSTGYYYDSHGNLRKEKNAKTDTKLYTYDGLDNRITATDERGVLTKYIYDNDLNSSLIKVERIGQNHTIVNARSYDYAGNLLTETDGNGNVTRIVYDDANRVYQKITPTNTTTYEYYLDGHVASEVNSLGEKTTYTYDSRGHQTEKRVYKDANTYVSIKSSYDGFGRLIKTTDGNNNETSYTYDKNDHVLTVTDALNGVTTYRYDDDGNKVGERSPRAENDAQLRNQYGDSVTYFYDGLGHLIKQVNAVGKITSNFYDANGNLLKTVDRQSLMGQDATHVTQYAYDKINLLTKQTFADNSHIDYTYDKVGNRLTKTDQENRTWVYGYDDFNRVATETDPANKVTKFDYDDNNNKTKVTYRDNTTVSFEYYPNNLVKKITDEQGNIEKFTYDAAGNKKTYVNKLNRTTGYSYDLLNRLETQTDAAGTVTTYTYDDNNNRLSVKVGAVKTSYTYDALNRLKNTTYPTGKVAKTTYDENGNVATTVDAKNQTITYTYDALNRMLTKELPGNVVMGYSYDNWNNVLTTDGPTEKIVATYDSLNRQKTAEHTIVDLNKKYNVNTDYALDGQVLKLTDGAGKAIDYGYNNRGELGTVTYGTTTLAAYTYTNVGKPYTITYGNGVVATWGYDNLNRPTAVTLTDKQSARIFSQQYSYDPAGNRLAFSDNGESTTTYKYDLLDQLVGVDYSTVNGLGTDDLVFGYDDNGNRTSANTPYGNMSYGYTALTNELKTINYNGARLAVATQFDNNGSLTKETYLRLGKADKTVTYGWDAQNRLASITYTKQNRPGFLPNAPDNTMAFAYDDAGNRIQKTVNGESAYYINNGLSVLNELDSNGVVTKTIVMGLGQVAQIDAGDTIIYTHQDVLGSTMLRTDSTGTIVSKYQYDPFGQLIGKEAANDTNYLFTGQEYDPESDLYYYNARYYNPSLGRFISRDPMLGSQNDTLGYNEYAYARNNPLKYVDPSGMVTEQYLAQLQYEQQLWAYQTSNSSPQYLYKQAEQAQIELGQAALQMGPGWQWAMDHPYLTGTGVGLGAGAVLVVAPPLISSAAPYLVSQLTVGNAIKGVVGAALNMGGTYLGGKLDDRQISAGEYAYAGVTGAGSVLVPGSKVVKGAYAALSNGTQQKMFKDSVDYFSVGISFGGTYFTSGLLGKIGNGVSEGIEALTSNPFAASLSEGVLNFSIEQSFQTINYGLQK